MSAALPSAAASPAKWTPYPEYKDSGVEWLDQIPSHWVQVPLKRLLVSLKDGTHGTFERVIDGVPLLSAKNIGNGQLEISDHDSLISYEDYESINRNGYLKQEDLLLTIVGTIGRAAVFNWPDPVAFQRSVAVLRVRSSCEVRYFRYLTQAKYFQIYLWSSAKQSAQSGVYLNDVARLPALAPLPSEQRAIAAFLDRETAKIDALVAKKERLIELLQEKRTALISQAVTKGLDPTMRMKDSGVEWLGNVPVHWEIRRVRDVSQSLQTGPFGSQLHSEDYSAGGTPVINPSHMKDGRIHPDWECAVDKKTFERLARHRLSEGDIIFARRGELGRCALVTVQEDGWLCGTGSLRMRPNRQVVEPRFLNWVLSTPGVSDWLSLESVGATMDNLNTSILGRIPLPIPGLPEQQVIATFLNRVTAKIDALIAKVQEHIEKLREYRVALISAAVTGKIDVREDIA